MARQFGLRLLIALLFTMVWGAAAQAQQAGTMRYNNVAKKYEFHDGTKWYYVGGTLTLLETCTPEQEAQMEYDPLLIISYKYCDGSHWQRIVGTATLELCSQPGVIDYRLNTYMYCNGLLWTRMKGGQSPSV